jgi:hypothetical protein
MEKRYTSFERTFMDGFTRAFMIGSPPSYAGKEKSYARVFDMGVAAAAPYLEDLPHSQVIVHQAIKEYSNGVFRPHKERRDADYAAGVSMAMEALKKFRASDEWRDLHVGVSHV